MDKRHFERRMSSLAAPTMGFGDAPWHRQILAIGVLFTPSSQVVSSKGLCPKYLVCSFRHNHNFWCFAISDSQLYCVSFLLYPNDEPFLVLKIGADFLYCIYQQQGYTQFYKYHSPNNLPESTRSGMLRFAISTVKMSSNIGRLDCL